MALTDILMERVARKGRTAQVVCHELGIVTVETLPVGEFTALLRGPDSSRAVVYAACRELQTVGESLRRRGQLFQPDEIMRFLSEDEVQIAFQAILDLSGPELRQQVFSQTNEGMSTDATAELGGSPVSQSSAPAPSTEASPFMPELLQRLAAAADGEPAQALTAPRFDAASPQDSPLARHSAPHAGSAALHSPRSTAEVRNEALSSRPAAEPLSSEGTQLDEEALTERVARRILTGLRRAAAVR